MNEADLQQLTARLKERREEILAESGLGKEERKPVELDQTSVGRLSRMDAMQNQAMAQATERRRQSELLRIKAAFGRIETDDYGYCLTCGNDIAVKRLEIDPSASVCIDCAGRK